jgi:hypothetical protein
MLSSANRVVHTILVCLALSNRRSREVSYSHYESDDIVSRSPAHSYMPPITPYPYTRRTCTTSTRSSFFLILFRDATRVKLAYLPGLQSRIPKYNHLPHHSTQVKEHGYSINGPQPLSICATTFHLWINES